MPLTFSPAADYERRGGDCSRCVTKDGMLDRRRRRARNIPLRPSHHDLYCTMAAPSFGRPCRAALLEFPSCPSSLSDRRRPVCRDRHAVRCRGLHCTYTASETRAPTSGPNFVGVGGRKCGASFTASEQSRSMSYKPADAAPRMIPIFRPLNSSGISSGVNRRFNHPLPLMLGLLPSSGIGAQFLARHSRAASAMAVSSVCCSVKLIASHARLPLARLRQDAICVRLLLQLIEPFLQARQFPAQRCSGVGW